MLNVKNSQEEFQFLHQFHSRKTSRKNGLHLAIMTELVQLFKIDLEDFTFIQIAGSCGKGSTAEMISSVLNAHHTPHGLYTGPHLIQYEERFKISGSVISRKELLQTVRHISTELAGYPRESNVGHAHIMFLIALLFFKQNQIRLVIFENGVGGWSDPSNIFNPAMSILTEIALDHTHLLGNSIEEITKDKMRIIKEKTEYVVCGTRNERAKAILQEAEKNSQTRYSFIDSDYQTRILSASAKGSTFDYEGAALQLKAVHLPVPGKHQVQNAATALALVECLISAGYAIETEKIKLAFETLHVPCRMETIMSGKKTFLLDAAHNGHELHTLQHHIRTLDLNINQMLLSFSSNKNIQYMIESLHPDKETELLIVPNPFSERQISLEEVETHLKRAGLTYKCFPDIESGLQSIQDAQTPGTVLVTGSMYLTGYVKNALKQGGNACSTP